MTVATPTTPAMPVTVRPAVPADAEHLSAFARRVFDETFAADNSAADMAAYLDSAFTPALQSAELGDPRAAILLAEATADAEEGQAALAGYAHLVFGGAAPACVAGPAPAELKRFYVDRAFQGRGAAARLMDAAIATAVARGARTLWLGVWERNARAIAFYGKRGFADVGAQRFVLGSDVQTDRVLARAIGAG